MLEVRFSIFETNSSSVHALIIPKDNNIHYPEEVTLYGGDYGWSGKETDGLQYIFQICADRGKYEIENLVDYLESKGIEVVNKEYILGDKFNNSGYVDHGYELPLEDLFADEGLLDRFMFGGGWVDMSNDNVEDEDMIPDPSHYDSELYDVIIK